MSSRCTLLQAAINRKPEEIAYIYQTVSIYIQLKAPMFCMCRPSHATGAGLVWYKSFVFNLADDSIPSKNILPLAYTIQIIHNAAARWLK